MGVLADYVRQAAEKKKISAAEWLKQNAPNAKKCRLATHVGKFINPDTDVTVFVQPHNEADKFKEFVSTTSTSCTADIATNAANLGIAKLLLLVTEDGKTVYEHLLAEENFLENELGDVLPDSFNYSAIRGDLLEAESDYEPAGTDTKLRQVYFPVGKGDYHLLTVLSPSSVMVELRSRIRTAEEDAYKKKDKPSKGDKYQQIYNLTEIGIGGANPRNISTLNNYFRGKMYLLPSLPPELQRRKVSKPNRSFFVSNLFIKDFLEAFEKLHKIYSKDKNNLEIRNKARKDEKRIINMIMFRACLLQEETAGWSDGKIQLSQSEKIWLDNKYDEQRKNDTSWHDEIAGATARWIYQTYKYIYKDKAVPLSNSEFIELKYSVKHILEENI